MKTESADSQNADDRLGAVLAACLQVLDKGEADEPTMLAQYPEYAAELKELFADQHQMDRLAAPLRPAVQAAQAEPHELGDFRIVREVGRGGMGVVYEAEQMSLKRRVALKVLPFAGALDARQLQRFKNESQAAAQLHHTNIVPVYFVGCERSVHFYAMQYIEGQSLADVIAELRRTSEPRPSGSGDRQDASTAYTALPDGRGSDSTTPVAIFSTQRSTKDVAYFRTVAQLGIQAAEALDYAHQQGIVHRDIKPANLLIDHARRTTQCAPRLWITDFGLACFRSDSRLTVTGDLVGTLRYMSPEQALGKRELIDHRTDIYSLGVTLYECLTLELAFAGSDRQELLQQIADDEPVPPRRLNPAIPVELETIVVKAIAKEPEARYPTAQALADDLKNFLEHKPIQARRPTLWEQVRKWARRHRGVVATAITAAILLLLFSVAAVGTGAILIDQERAEAIRQRDEAQRLRQEALEREEALREQLLHLYISDMREAYQAWETHDLELLQNILNRHQSCSDTADLRGFEWFYVRNLLTNVQAATVTRTLRGHTGAVYHVTYSRDGRFLATAGEDRTARLWDRANGREVGRFEGHGSQVNCVSFSPGGTRLATGSQDGKVRVWNRDTRQVQLELLGHTDECDAVEFSPDGGTLASGGWDGQLILWDALTGRQLHQIKACPGCRVEALAFTPDGKEVATVSDLGVSLWDVVGGQLRIAFPSLGMEAHALSVTPDGRKLGATFGNSARVWRIATGQQEALLEGGESNEALAFSSDGHTLAVADRQGMLRVWDLNQQVQRHTRQAHAGIVWSLAFAPDAEELASAGADAVVRIHKFPQENHSPVQDLTHFAERVAFSPDGALLVIGDASGSLLAWDRGAGKLRYLTGPVRAANLLNLVFSPNGKWLAADWADGSVSLTDAATGRGLPVHHLDNSPHPRSWFTPDGKTLVTTWCVEQWKVGLWDVSTGQFRILSVPKSVQLQVGYPMTPLGNGQTLLAGLAGPQRLAVWDLAGAEVRDVATYPTNSKGFALSPDRRLLAIWRDWTVTLWGAENLEPCGRLLGNTGEVSAIAFTSDNKTLATGSTGGLVKLWNIRTGKEYCTLERVEGPVHALAFSPDGRELVGIVITPEGSRKIRVWSRGDNLPKE
jgi:WD40 repeat protein/serine/threonine protein kinase